MIISLDAMGGDYGPSVVVPAAIDVLKENKDLELILVGDRQKLEQAVAQHGGTGLARLNIVHASQCVDMDELPSQALRNKKDSSMRVALNLLKEGRVHACVSAGNTGALMATARYVLKTLPGIDRPAICTVLPTITGHVHMLDLGANIDVNACHLTQFAVMGHVLTAAVENISSPRLGLLNIGEEEMKGHDEIKAAAASISSLPEINYVGYVEGNDIFTGEVDVVVCDGFVGNVALKTSEGVARMISHYLKGAFGRNLLTKLAGLAVVPILKQFKKSIDPRQYNGASLLGLRGIVIKSHGGADTFAFKKAIEEAVREVAKDVPNQISKHLDTLLQKRAIA